MIRVPDAASLAAMRIVSGLLGRRVGASTGTHFAGVLQLLCEMKAAGESGSIVTLLCDSGERYAGTCYRDDWLAGQGIDIAPELARLQTVLATGHRSEARRVGKECVSTGRSRWSLDQ